MKLCVLNTIITFILSENFVRILVTHGVSYLPKVDRIYVMKDGRITEKGTYLELLKRGGEFADFLIQHLTEEEDHNELTDAESEEIKQGLEATMGREGLQRRISQARSALTSVSSMASSSSRAKLKKEVKRRERTFSQSTTMDQVLESEVEVVTAPGQTLIADEKSEVGGVRWAVYAYYIRCIGVPFFSMTLLLLLAYQGFQLGGNIWLSVWTADPAAASGDQAAVNKYLAVYGVLGMFQSGFVFAGTACLMRGTLNASAQMHETMLARIMRAPMSFFDTTPLGRVLNRFSKDVDIVDVTVPVNLRMLTNQALIVGGTLVVICYALPIFISVVVPILIMYYLLQKFYVATARQVKRMESVTRSPIYSHFGETISGAVTIRAFNRVGDFVEENERKIDFNQACYYPTFASSRWLSVRLESVGNLIVLFAALFAVLGRETIDPGRVGLALSYALNVTGAMNMLVRMTSEIETNMVSAERIGEYQQVPQEAPFDAPEGQPEPSKEWPQYGVVEFDNYQTRYC